MRNNLAENNRSRFDDILVSVGVFDPQAKAEVLREAIERGEDRSAIRSLFIGLTSSISEGTDGLAAEHMAELRALVAVYEEYDEKYYAELSENLRKGLTE